MHSRRLRREALEEGRARRKGPGPCAWPLQSNAVSLEENGDVSRRMKKLRKVDLKFDETVGRATGWGPLFRASQGPGRGRLEPRYRRPCDDGQLDG
jgi:hypothetical protein